MVRIRNKRTLVEKNVPERAVKYFPDYEVVGAASPRRSVKPEKSSPPKAKQSETPAAVDTDTEE